MESAQSERKSTLRYDESHLLWKQNDSKMVENLYNNQEKQAVLTTACSSKRLLFY